MRPRIGIVCAERFRTNDQRAKSPTDRSYLDAVIRAEGLPLLIPVSNKLDLVSDYLNVCDGLILPGGGDIDPKFYGEADLAGLCQHKDVDRDTFELKLVDAAIAFKLPILAICRGIQVVNVARGGSLYQDISKMYAGNTEIAHSQPPSKACMPAHEVKLAPGSKLANLLSTDSLEVNSTHHQAIKVLGANLRAVGKSPDGLIEAIEMEAQDDEPHIIGVQWHPERLLAEHLVLFQWLTESARRARK